MEQELLKSSENIRFLITKITHTTHFISRIRLKTQGHAPGASVPSQPQILRTKHNVLV